MEKKRLYGIALAALGAMIWGVSGPASELLFDQHVDLTWLISTKMLIAGIITMAVALLVDKQAVAAPWKNRKSSRQMVVFIFLGMIGMQYAYYKAVEVANAPTATILQYVSPVLVLVYLALATHTLPRRIDISIVVLAMFGTLMVVTKGHLTQLAIGPEALFWGLLTAVAAALYTLLPAALLTHYSALAVTAWAQLLGGIVMTVVRPFWVGIPHLNALGWWAYAFIVLFGTVFAYLMYLGSLNYISPTAVSLLDAFEPLGATLTSVLFLGFHLGGAELIGGGIIIIAVALMALTAPKSPQAVKQKEA